MDQIATLKLDQHELMCRLIEAATGEERPAGRSPKDLVLTMIDEETCDFFASVSRAAIHYFIEQHNSVLGIGRTKH